MDDDESHALNLEEFTKGVSDSGLSISEKEVAEVFSSVDKDGSGCINIDEFLLALRVS